MHPRAADLVKGLALEPHPEGGHYRQIYRSTTNVQPLDVRPPRAALTTIYFLLTAGDVSRWHRVASDEAWHFYEGAPIELFSADQSFEQVERHVLGPVNPPDVMPVHVVPAHRWQAARSLGDFTLVGCTVGPGFAFADFTLLRDLHDEAGRLRSIRPEFALFT
ncbi:MAG: cupin domain-containing protein [Vicinamibacterales bacterium]